MYNVIGAFSLEFFITSTPVRAEEDPGKSLAEVRAEDRVYDRIQGGVEVPEPQEETSQVITDHTR